MAAVPITLRIEPETLARIERLAKVCMRTRNKQLAYIIQRGLDGRFVDQLPSPGPRESAVDYSARVKGIIFKTEEEGAL